MQKSGRLSDDSQDLLERCGLKVRYHAQRLLAMAENMPVEILRVRDDDIPGLVMDGVVDLGIIGENVLEETVLARRSQGQSTDFRMLRLSPPLSGGQGWRCVPCMGTKGDKRGKAGRPLHGERLFSWWTPGKGKT